MATLRPFAALRPRPDLARRICELPYDVMSSEEARALAADNPLSFLHVSKPEIDLPPGTGLYDPIVYATGRDNFRRLIDQGALRQDAAPRFYLYRQVMGSHTQTGLVAVASCEEYQRDVVRKHELTRPDKEDDRVRHIEALYSQTGPVFLVHNAVTAIDDLVRRRTASEPEIDFVAADGIRHSSWTVSEPDDIHALEQEFARLECLYIADGHHRCAAAARVFKTRQGAGQSPWFLAVTFPHNQMRILPYNRVLKDLNGLSPARLWQRLESVFAISDAATAQPAARHELGFYFEGRWRRLAFRPALTASTDAMETLDVTLLQKLVLAPVFGIDDPRTSQRISFVGGVRGTDELERMVQSGDHACAFAMHPTGIEELMAIADAGGIMPPKSTWFEPKLRDAMFCHLL
jgi:uncharacterized protein (DUF1015 family)